MQRVINTETEKTISIDDINNDTIVGVAFKGCEKAIILCNESGQYYGASKLKNKFNHPSSWESKSKKEYVQQSVSGQGAKAYVFDTFGELFEWMLK